VVSSDDRAQFSKSVGKICCFCGSPDLTKEHIWPNWLRGIFKVERLTHTIGGHGSAAQKKQWLAPPFTAQAQLVCSKCNSGWMSRLEGRSKRVLSLMIQCKAADLVETEQRLVTTWAVKTAMMMQVFVHPSRVTIPPDHYRQLYQRKDAPPDTVRVWLALQDHTDPRYVAKPLGLFASLPKPPIQPNAYWVTLTIGCLVMQILGAAGPLPRYLDDGIPVLRVLPLLRIWPAQTTVRWPPLPPLTHEDVGRLLGAFDGQEPLEWIEPTAPR
jgi:hypothetical protein